MSCVDVPFILVMVADIIGVGGITTVAILAFRHIWKLEKDME